MEAVLTDPDATLSSLPEVNSVCVMSAKGQPYASVNTDAVMLTVSVLPVVTVTSAGVESSRQ